jgi:vitamin B12 transporter
MRPTSVLALFVAALAATNAQAGRLSGTVTAPDGRPLSQLPIRVTGDTGTRTVITTVGGRYVADDLVAGAYHIESGVPGFVVGARAEATVGEAETRLDVTLTAAPLREQVLVAATRSEAAASTVGVTASVLDRERIEAREASSLAVLLQELPGVTIARTGPLGQQGSAFVRGGESRFARIMIDGIPLNEPGGAYNLGALLPFELERVELVRGAASSLYGTDALAGVIQLVTKRAAAGEAPAAFAEAQGGGFDWRGLRGGTSGRSGALDWNAAVLRLETDNEVPNSAFEATSGAASLGATLTERLSLRAFFRGEDSHTGTPGPTAFGPADLEEFIDRTDLAGAVSLRYVGPQVTHELQLGTSSSDQLTADPGDSGSFVPEWNGQPAAFPRSDFVNDGFRNDTRRSFAGYRLEASLGGRHLVSVGADVERETGELGTSFELLTPERTNVGAYAQDRLVLGRAVFVTVGGRVEHNESFGTEVVPRAAVAWRVRGSADATLVKASGGLGIKEPGFFESFGVSTFARGNPDLKPERSRTADLGVEQHLFDDRLRLEATFFHHDYRDQVAYQLVDPTTFEGTYVNLGRTRARGLELAAEAAPRPWLRLTGEYTRLDAEVVVSNDTFNEIYAVGQPLLRRPRNEGSLGAELTSTRASLGATAVFVGRRADSDFVGIGLTENEAYTRVDARARVRLAARVEAFVAGENLLDREYMEALGYPALGRAFRVGVRVRSAGSWRR